MYVEGLHNDANFSPHLAKHQTRIMVWYINIGILISEAIQYSRKMSCSPSVALTSIVSLPMINLSFITKESMDCMKISKK